MAKQLFTIGHSTHDAGAFLALLTQHGIAQLIDVRRFPGSRNFPHFNREDLAQRLSDAEIEYHWLEALGGRRHTRAGVVSKNVGLRNSSFRSYADYMASPEFQSGIAELLRIAAAGPTAYMCSEGLFWRCHRRLISDYLLAQGIAVRHIMPDGELRPHPLTGGAKIANGIVTYPGEAPDTPRTLFEK